MRGANLSGYQQNIAIGYKPCPNCGAPMKTDAQTCAKCGQGNSELGLQNSKKNYLLILLALVGLLLIIVVLLLLSQK